MDADDTTGVADMENRPEERNDESQEALHVRTAGSRGDEGDLDSRSFIGTQRLPTGAVGPPGPRLATLRCGIDRRQQVG